MTQVIWLTGISGSGKTTLGLKLKQGLEQKHNRVEFLDGDIVRKFFENDLGYTREDRIKNIKRIAFAAMLLARNGTYVVVANIAPYYEVRDFIRRHIKDYIQIYLRISVEKAIERDIKGHYARYKNGQVKNIVGLDDTYDVPRHPDLIVNTESETVEDSFGGIANYLKERGVY